jgi:hypothetical protein
MRETRLGYKKSQQSPTPAVAARQIRAAPTECAVPGNSLEGKMPADPIIPWGKAEIALHIVIVLPQSELEFAPFGIASDG